MPDPLSPEALARLEADARVYYPYSVIPSLMVVALVEAARENARLRAALEEAIAFVREVSLSDWLATHPGADPFDVLSWQETEALIEAVRAGDRLRAALEFYARPETYDEPPGDVFNRAGGIVPIDHDHGAIARAALNPGGPDA